MDLRKSPVSVYLPESQQPASEVFDSGGKTIVDLAHVRVERLDTVPVLFSKVFKQYEGRQGQKYDYRYWAERENFFLREFLKKQQQFSHVVQPRHLISENEAAKQVLTYDAGITVANWLRVKPRYQGGTALSHPFQRPAAWLNLLRACLLALKQIHQHGIVHCDIKEDNICLPYAPAPWQDANQEIHLEFDRLKLIDFAFSIAHWMPLTQILIINPDDRAPYQSARLVEALRADRLSGSPNAVQQLDYRVDLFSLGYMAGKIMGAGLECPPGAAGQRVREGASALVARLQASDTAQAGGSLPHDGLIAGIDAMLETTADFPGARNFVVAGEWTADEIRPDRTGARKTPLTPVAPPVPTPVALPAPVLPLLISPVREPSVPRKGMELWKLTLGIILGLVFVLLAATLFLRGREHAPPSAPAAAVAKPAPPQPAPDAFAQVSGRLATQLRGSDDKEFQAAWSGLAPFATQGKAAAMELANTVLAENTAALNAPGARPSRVRAFARLQWMGSNGNNAAVESVTSFEKSYDQAKQGIVRSPWWTRGEGGAPDEVVTWLENGAVLAANSDRPALLDQAFATGYGRSLALDRAASVQIYLNVIARAQSNDESSKRIRLAASHGLSAMLNRIVEQKDHAAVVALQPVLEPMAARGAPDMQFYLGLFSECVQTPRDLNAARLRYRQAVLNPAWRPSAVRRLFMLGRACPAPAK